MDQLCLGRSLPAAELAESRSIPAATIVSEVVLYREGLAASLARDGRVKVLDIVTPPDALPAISRRLPDVVLLDGAMSECLMLARQIRAMVPGLRMVGFAISGGADRLVECAESGLAAFVDCDGSADELINVIFGALKGEFACSPRLSALMCERLARLAAGSTRTLALTQREREIAVLIGRGLSNKEIARDLNIGPSTVKNHVHSILEKLSVKRRSAVVQQLSGMSWMREKC